MTVIIMMVMIVVRIWLCSVSENDGKGDNECLYQTR